MWQVDKNADSEFGQANRMMSLVFIGGPPHIADEDSTGFLFSIPWRARQSNWLQTNYSAKHKREVVPEWCEGRHDEYGKLSYGG